MATREKTVAGTFGARAIRFFRSVTPPVCPDGITVLNPYDDGTVRSAVESFYTRYFNDTNKRVFLIGINPGRFGAGVTGIAFTDTDALRSVGVPHAITESRELSAEFVRAMIDGYGGARKFYRKFFLTSICPFGFTKNGVNLNYYDDPDFFRTLSPYICDTFSKQVRFGAKPTAVVLGKGKNFSAVKKMNDACGWFEKVVPLEHPRFIMQYRRSSADSYVALYRDTLNGILKES